MGIEFREYLMHTDTPITVEAPIFGSIDEVEKFASRLKGYKTSKYIGGVNVVNYPFGRLTPDPALIGCLFKRYIDLEPILHIPSSLESKYTLVRTLYSLYICGIRNILLLGGDVKTEYGLKLDEAFNYIKQFSEGYIDLEHSRLSVERFHFHVGGAAILDRDDEVDRIIWKIRMGMKFFQTQYIYDYNLIREVLTKLDAQLTELNLDTKVPMLLGILPYLDEDTRGILGRIGLNIFSKYDTKEYRRYINTLISRLIKLMDSIGLIKIGFHFMPIRWKDEVYEEISKIIESLI